METLADNAEYLKRLIKRFAESNQNYSYSSYQSCLAAFVVIFVFDRHPLKDLTTKSHPDIAGIVGSSLDNDELLRKNEDFIMPVIHDSNESLLNLIWGASRVNFSKEDLLDVLHWILGLADVEVISTATPDEVVNLMLRLVNVSGKSTVFDPAMGTGGFLRLAKTLDPPAGKCLGVEVNRQVGFVGRLYSLIEDIPVEETKIDDAFEISPYINEKFDYVLSNPPITRIPLNIAHIRFEGSLRGRQPSGEMSLNFVQLGLSKLKQGGRAAFLVNMGVLYSQGDAKRVRREWIERGVIRQVIALPAKLLPHTTNKCAILLFENEQVAETIVKFVKADDLYEAVKPGHNIMSDTAYSEIKERLEKSERTIDTATVDYADIEAADYSLHPDTYVKKEIDEIALNVAKQWVKLSDVAEIIQGTRGLKKSPTGDVPIVKGENIQALRVGALNLAKVDMTTCKGKVKYAKANDLLLKRIGDRSSVYMVKPTDPERIVDQTVFILRFKELSPASVHFIGEFLNSDRGSSHISSFCRSTTAQTLTKTVLSEIDVPLADDQLQELLREMTDAEQSLKSEFDRAKDLKKQIFDGLGYEQALGDFDSVRFALKTLETALSQKDKVSYKVSSSYPFPLAYVYRNVYMDREWSAVYDRQLKFGEMILSFLVSVGLALLDYHSENYGRLLEKIRADLRKALPGGISPGHWQSLLHEICIQLRQIPDCPMATEFSAMWFKGRGKQLSDFAQKTTTEFVQKLNNKKHHKGAFGAEASKVAAQSHAQVIDDMLLNIEFISQWDFFINDSLRYEPGNNTFVCSIRRLRGDHPCFEQSEFISAKPLADGEVYLRHHSVIVPLKPFIVNAYNEKTQRDEIYSLDKKSSREGFLLKSYDSGDIRVPDETSRNLLTEWLDKGNTEV